MQKWPDKVRIQKVIFDIAHKQLVVLIEITYFFFCKKKKKKYCIRPN